MTDKQPDRAEREAFEQAMNTARFFPRQIDFRKTASPSGKRDVLVNSLLESCWIGWQARAALAAPQPGYVLVPVEPTHDMLRALSGEWHPSRHQPERYAAMLAAARKAPQQEAPAVPDDPMDWKLPCDVTVGHGTIGKGGVSGPLLGGTLRTQAQPVGDEREAFEAHWRNSNGYETLTWDAMCKRQGVPVPEGCEGRYFYREPRLAWGAWQARAALAAPQQAAPAFPINSAPKDGRLLRLQVMFDEAALEDDSSKPIWTIGFNALQDTGVDAWQFAGWNWVHDVFCEGAGTPVGWLPMLEAAPQQEVQYDHGPQADAVAEAARDVGKWLNERPNRPLDLRHVAMLAHHVTAQPAPSGDALQLQLERERICAAIKAEDDYCIDQGDYMLDSDDCIKIVRGEWVRPEFAGDAARKEGPINA